MLMQHFWKQEDVCPNAKQCKNTKTEVVCTHVCTDPLSHWTWWLHTQLTLDPMTEASQPSLNSHGRYADGGLPLQDKIHHTFKHHRKNWSSRIWLSINQGILFTDDMILLFLFLLHFCDDYKSWWNLVYAVSNKWVSTDTRACPSFRIYYYVKTVLMYCHITTQICFLSPIYSHSPAALRTPGCSVTKQTSHCNWLYYLSSSKFRKTSCCVQYTQNSEQVWLYRSSSCKNTTSTENSVAARVATPQHVPYPKRRKCAQACSIMLAALVIVFTHWARNKG